MFQENPLDPASGYLLLLSLPGKSALLYFDSKFTAASATELEEDQTSYELSYSTFLVTLIDEATILQVTEEDIIFVGPNTRYISASFSAFQTMLMTDLDSSRFTFASIGLGSAVVTDAKLYEDSLVVTTHTEDGFQLYTVQLDIRGRQIKQVQNQTFNDGEVTSLSLWHHAGILFAVACLWRGKAVYLDFHCITSRVPVKSIALQDRKS